MAYTKYSLTPSSNTAAPPDGAPEGMLPSAVNDTMRDMMAQIRDCGDGIRGGTYTMTAPIITGGTINGATIGATTASTGKFTAVTNSALTSGRVTYAGTAGVLQDDADFTFNGTTVTMANDASISGLTVGKGGGADTGTTALGGGALQSNTTGINQTAVGYQSLFSSTSANANQAFGYRSLYTNTTGVNNLGVGHSALYLNTTGSANVALGRESLYSNTTASNNTAVGYQAGYSNTTATNITALGYFSLYSNTTGVNNTAVGMQSLDANTTGEGNTAIGLNALGLATTGSSNTAIGLGAGGTITTGSKNTIVGRYDGNQGGLDIRTASNNIVLSDGDGNPRARWDSNGTQTTTASSTDGYAFSATNSQATRPYGIWSRFSGATPNNTTQSFLDCEDTTNIKLAIYSSGTVTNRTGTYNAFSDIKLKQDIVDAGSQWDDIKAVRVRKFRLKDEVAANPDTKPFIGVIAQELEQTSAGLIDDCYDRNGEMTKSVKYSILYMKAIKALQEAMERIETLEAKVTALENK